MEWLPEITEVFGYSDVMKVAMGLAGEEVISGEVYKHSNTMNNDKSYIGIAKGQGKDGSERRWKQHVSEAFNPKIKNASFHNAIIKYGELIFSHVIVESVYNTTWKELGLHEMFWIAFYDTFEGFGYNGTYGGDGVPMYEDIRKKISETKTGVSVNVGENNPMYGKRGLNNPTSMPIKGIHIITGDIAYFESSLEASKALGINNRNISSCVQGKRTHAGDYKWTKISKEEYIHYKNEEIYVVNKNLIAIDLQTGEQIDNYDGLHDAEIKTGIKATSICNNLTNKSKSAGKTPEGHKIKWKWVYICTQLNEAI